MASSIPSMSVTNNIPLSLSISSSPTTSTTSMIQEKSQSLNNSTTKNLDKIKNADYLLLQHHDQSDPLNFSSKSSSSAPTNEYNHHRNERKEKRLRTSSVQGGSTIMVRSPSRRNSLLFQQQYNSNEERFLRSQAWKQNSEDNDRFEEEGNNVHDQPLSSSLLTSARLSSNGESCYHLKWDDHINSTVSAIQSLLENETFVDVTLVCDDEEEESTDEFNSTNINHESEKVVGKKLNNNQKNESNNNTILNPQIESDNDDEEESVHHDADIDESNDDDNDNNMLRNDFKSIKSKKVIKRVQKKKNSTGTGITTTINSSSTTTTIQQQQNSPTKFKAHKAILSSCSEYFCRIFSENPCKHPVILLKDFQPWEISALLDFIYKGQVIVKPERLEALVKAAESLQIYSLKECIEKSQEWKQRKTASSKNVMKATRNQINDEVEREKLMLLREGTQITTTSSISYNNEEAEGSNNNNSRNTPPAQNAASKFATRLSYSRSHEMKNILNFDDNEDDNNSEEPILSDYEDDDDVEEDSFENGPSSPKLLNLSMSVDSLQANHDFHQQNHHHRHLRQQHGEAQRVASFTNRRHSRNSSSQIHANVRNTDEPQTTEEQSGDFPHNQNHLHHHQQQHQQHHGQTNPSASSPPFPRRKQARPRRRSGDFVAQDLRTTPNTELTDPYLQPLHYLPPHEVAALQLQQQKHANNNNDDQVLDFTIGNQHLLAKRNNNTFNERSTSQVNNFVATHFMKSWSSSTSGTGSSPPVHSPHHLMSSPMKHETDSEDVVMSPVVDNNTSPPETPALNTEHQKLLRRERLSRRKPHYRSQELPIPAFGNSNNITSPPGNFFMNLNNINTSQHALYRHLNAVGHNSDPETNKDLETPTSPPKSFSPPVGFPMPLPGNGNSTIGSPVQQWPGLPLGPPPIFGRHRAQHSAPRGGPPRAWSNADLTEALHNVWNKKMTTSQASRIFGIPYNSLLMYVRGKYGKSLKLDLLKKGLDLAMLEKANNNNNRNNSSSSSGTSTSNRSSTPSSNNNNNNNNSSNKSKSHSANSPPLSLNVNSLMGGGDCEQQREKNFHSSSSNSINSMSNHNHHHNHNNNRNDPQDIISSGFNPFSIFGEYPPPFPFSNAAAAAALSHILPPPPPQSTTNHLAMLGVAGEKVHNGNRTSSHHDVQRLK